MLGLHRGCSRTTTEGRTRPAAFLYERQKEDRLRVAGRDRELHGRRMAAGNRARGPMLRLRGWARQAGALAIFGRSVGCRPGKGGRWEANEQSV